MIRDFNLNGERLHLFADTGNYIHGTQCYACNMAQNNDEAIGRLVANYKETQSKIAALKSEIFTTAEHMTRLGDALSDDLGRVVLTDAGYDLMRGTSLGIPALRPEHHIPTNFADNLRDLLEELRNVEKVKGRQLECLEEAGIASIIRD